MKTALRLLAAFVAVCISPAVHAEATDASEPATTVIASSVANAVTSSTAAASAVAQQLQTGLASYYARGFEGMRTASGEIFRHAANMAAHPTWPLGTLARVTHLATGRSVEVRIMDRGPASRPRSKGVIIDLSQSAAHELDMLRSGLAKVKVEVLEWGRSR